jgi:hypothetical protein
MKKNHFYYYYYINELLLVSERPDIRLHNNSAENAIRKYVGKRKISDGTRSESGRRARDTFKSLKIPRLLR